MKPRIAMLAMGVFLAGSQAFAGGGDSEPWPVENPPASFRLSDTKQVEISCKYCEGECPQEAGYKKYRYKFERRWHSYICKRINLGSFDTRSYSDAE